MAFSAKPYLREISIADDAGIDFDSYPFNIPAVRDMGVIEPHADVTFFVGENGAGKSTVLEAIAVAMGLPSEGGTRNVSRGQQEASPLQDCLKIVKSFRKPAWSYFLRAESLFNVFTYIDQVGSLKPSKHIRSHGEAFMDVMLEFSAGGLYLLDEPEAALSPNRQLAALSAIDQLVRQDCQFIIATHSPILLSYPNAKILQFDGSGITEVEYEDTEHFAVTRDFLNHYPRRLQQLLADD
ncbi:AAA family ATPase [Massilia sp. CCM 9210]|uniref:AAA family ATPase n=1 Tax=Massilia scottii TaxID=3057166 RepID=UPI00279663F9|nr:AAA family ATPase [Massilia sp. CCM 9210]MDQ1815039.1 AAA family ATPase [Massilia sp. CCM 9210]